MNKWGKDWVKLVRLSEAMKEEYSKLLNNEWEFSKFSEDALRAKKNCERRTELEQRKIENAFQARHIR